MELEARVADLERQLETKQREVDSALAEAATARFFRKVLEASTDAITVIGPDTRASYVSPSHEAIAGIPIADYVGADVLQFLHPDDHPKVLQALAEVRAGPQGHVVRMELRRRHADGHWIHMDTAARNLGEDPDVRGVVVNGREIDAAVRLREQLREAQALFRALFEDTSVAVTLRDTATQQLLDCNSAVLRLYGFDTLDELVATTPDHLAANLQPDGRSSAEVLRDFVQRALKDGTARMEWLAKRRTGDTFLADIRTTVIRLDDGRRVMQSLIEDVTARRQAADALARAKEDAIAASATKSAFLANMSHELRTPLNGVIGMVDLLATTQLDERQRRYTQTAQASAKLLLSAISGILDFSKIEAGKLELELTAFSLHAIVDEVARVLRLSADEKALELRFSCDVPAGACFLGDQGRLRQVLVNLVSNAIKFTRRGGVRVTSWLVTDAEDSARVRTEVVDTGIGIPPRAQAKLFQSFTQVDASTTREHGGTGLGLAICRELVELMGGQIGLSSTLGEGSVFWFELPLQKAHGLAPRAPDEDDLDEPAPRAPSLIAPPAAAGSARVLIVEDSPVNAEIAGEILRAAGYAFDLVADGPKAIEAVMARAYDLILMDCQLPGMDGYDATRRIRALGRDGALPRRSGGPVPILALTASVTKGDLERCSAAGMSGHVSKPVDARRLLAAIATHLGRSKPADASSAKPAVADLPRALERLGGDRELLGRVTAQFVEGAPSALARLRAAVEARASSSEVAFATHRLRGQAATFGGEALIAAAAELDAAVLGSDWTEAGARLLVVEGELCRLLTTLKATS